MDLPAQDLRSNRGTWAVPYFAVPRAAYSMRHLLPPEKYDAGFMGQKLETTYFDTAAWDLRTARLKKDRYLTLRIRCYEAHQQAEAYALSAKTEGQKFRVTLASEEAEAILQGGDENWPERYLPADLLARLHEVAGDDCLHPTAVVCCRRYAVENAQDRLTLDLDVETHAGKRLEFCVLEHKSVKPDAWPDPPPGFYPLKLSKFLWATAV